MIKRTERIFREDIIDSQSIFNYIFSLVLFAGSVGFFLVGLFSYFLYDHLLFIKISNIVFFPQGLTMLFYGTLGLIFSLYQIVILFYKVGDGFNEFNKEKNIMIIYRKGFPGKKGEVYIENSLSDIESIRVEIKTEFFNTRQIIFVCLQGNYSIPVFQFKEPLSISEVEQKASELASFLKVPVKG
uniref:Photosystem I assembly protein Ycf4 n=1 Tax=Euglenaformis proxima TaxID=299110 RepID=A0A023HHN5_9EUGL|nr:photosystem I assembly protein ycf4 [Euglenaformis proxima]AGL11992.1 photosystem I assembly protein ycf4 [Euglenaformis proxima]